MLIRSPRPAFLRHPTWPSGYGGGRVHNLSGGGINIQAGGSNHLKGNYTTVLTVPFDADGFYLSLHQVNNSGLSSLVDIAIAASAGSEQIIVPNLGLDGCNTALQSIFEAYIPIPLKAGQLVRARAQSMTSSATTQVYVYPVAGDFFSSLRCAKCNVYGADTANSAGTQVDPGAAANNKGAWTQFSAGVVDPIRYMIVGHAKQNLARTSGYFLVDVGVGAGGSEAVLLGNLIGQAEAGNDAIMPVCWTRPVSVKQGVRLAVRAQSSITDATDRLIHPILHCFS